MVKRVHNELCEIYDNLKISIWDGYDKKKGLKRKGEILEAVELVENRISD